MFVNAEYRRAVVADRQQGTPWHALSRPAARAARDSPHLWVVSRRVKGDSLPLTNKPRLPSREYAVLDMVSIRPIHLAAPLCLLAYSFPCARAPMLSILAPNPSTSIKLCTHHKHIALCSCFFLSPTGFVGKLQFGLTFHPSANMRALVSAE